MAFNPQKRDKPQYELIEEGLYSARVARIIELGDQETKFGVKTQVVIGFTLPSLTIEHEGEQKQRMVWTFPINQTSNPDGKLMKYIKAVKSEAVHMEELLALPCMIEIIHTHKGEDTYANIGSITKPMTGMDIGMPDIDTYMYEFENGEDETFELIGEYRQNQVRAAVNFGM